MKLDELTRRQILAKNKVQDKARFDKRMTYKPVRNDGVDIIRLFEDDYFIFRNQVDTGHIATIAYHGLLKELKSIIKTKEDFKRINLKLVIKAITRSFDLATDVQVDCTCQDFKYTFNYWASHDNYKFGDLETRKPNKRNPNNDKGATCKHLSGMLSDKKWMVKAASYINKWIKAYPEDAFDYLLPDYEDKLDRERMANLDSIDDEIFDSQTEDDDVSLDLFDDTFDEAVIRENDEDSNLINLEVTKEELNIILGCLNKASDLAKQIEEFLNSSNEEE